MEAINYQLFKQAYTASLDVRKLLDQYEMSRLLKGPYDKQGACVVIRAGSKGLNHEVWLCYYCSVCGLNIVALSV
jgi:hypothetical protein